MCNITVIYFNLYSNWIHSKKINSFLGYQGCMLSHPECLDAWTRFVMLWAKLVNVFMHHIECSSTQEPAWAFV